MKMKSLYLVFVILVSTVLFSGCAGLLPSGTDVMKSRWNSYAEAAKSFGEIKVGVTTAQELKELGFDEDKTPNVKILTYLDVKKSFIVSPFDKAEDLPNGVKECIDSGDVCHGLEINIAKTDSKRYGNVVLDIFNFRRRTAQSGWEFNGFVVLKNDTVVYKLASGKPTIEGDRDQINPLGPLQSLDGMFFLDAGK